MKKVYSANEFVSQEQHDHKNMNIHEKVCVQRGLRVKTGVKSGSDTIEMPYELNDSHVDAHYVQHT